MGIDGLLPSSAGPFGMRILFITDKFIPERGGSQIIFGEMYAHLPEHEVTVLTRAWAGHQECDASYPHRVIRVPYSSVPKVRSPLLWAALASASRRLAERESFDQIHCGQTVETAPAGAMLARRLGIPMLMHTFAEDVTTYLRHPFYGPLMRAGLRGATVVTSISQFTLEHLLRLGVPSSRAVLLYPGLTPDQWKPTGGEVAIREKFGLVGRKVILTVSRLIPRKGQDVVLQAMPEVLRQVPEAVYFIVGSGPEEQRLRNLVQRLGLAGHVRFAGSIPNREACDYYHACDVFAMPNRRMPNGDVEGFGLVFLEANACGKPVIGGRSGGTPDAIVHGESGYLVDPTSPAEVASRVVELLTDPAQAAKLGEGGRERVRSRFTWRRTGAALHAAADLAARDIVAEKSRS